MHLVFDRLGEMKKFLATTILVFSFSNFVLADSKLPNCDGEHKELWTNCYGTFDIKKFYNKRGVIGFNTKPYSRYIEVTRVEKDSPAFKAGIKVGDTIININGVSVYGKSIAETDFWGAAGTSLDITVKREGQRIVIKNILRKKYTNLYKKKN